MNDFLINYIHPIENENSLSSNIDVYVVIDNVKYFATFFTVNNIITLMNNYKKNGECLNGEYFWATNLIIITKIENDIIHDCVKHMLDTGEFYNAFSIVDE